MSDQNKIQVFNKWSTWQQAKKDLISILDEDTIRMIDLAFRFAESHHRLQKRVNGELIIIHLLQVLEILVSAIGSTDVEQLVASILHDVLEDTSASEYEIRQHFGNGVGNLVVQLTKTKVVDENRKVESKDLYLQRFASASSQLLQIKLADRYSNVQFLSKDPDYARQKSYYAQTINQILPLTVEDPKFHDLFLAWEKEYKYLDDDR